MKKQLVYDLPMRVFHWIFAGLFVTAFLIAKTIDDDSPTYSYHMLAGLILSFTVILRLIWGLVGAEHARFSNFALSPTELVAYFNGILKGEKRKWAGHNPASSWTAIGMLLLSLGLGTTGYLMTSGQKEAFEDIHEIFANAFLVLVLMHIAGIILHTVRHRDSIALSMINGTKNEILDENAISSSYPKTALIFLALVLIFAGYTVQNYNSQTQSLKLFGNTLQLGEGSEAVEKSDNYDGHHSEENE